jgi:hypothetical protein
VAAVASPPETVLRTQLPQSHKDAPSRTGPTRSLALPCLLGELTGARDAVRKHLATCEVLRDVNPVGRLWSVRLQDRESNESISDQKSL